MKRHLRLAAALAVGLAVAAPVAGQVKKENVRGIVSFARLETTVACGGATSAAELPEIKKMGFASVINLRQASENGADVPAGEAAAKAAGLNYIHIPFNAGSPDPAVADRFISAITTPADQPAYIHCAGGVRAAAMWMIRRLVVDKWDVDRASEEATALGLTSPALKKFAIDYAQKRSQ
jgi:uncharacterized protein (TIGR01244 family)